MPEVFVVPAFRGAGDRGGVECGLGGGRASRAEGGQRPTVGPTLLGKSPPQERRVRDSTRTDV